MQKIDLSQRKKSSEIKAVKRIKKPKTPQIKEPKKVPKKHSVSPKQAKKLNKLKQKQLAQQEMDELAKRLNIQIIQKNQKEKTNTVLKSFAEEIKKNVTASVVGIYEIGKGEIRAIIGENLDNLIAEKYFSLGETTIFTNPCGINDDLRFRTRLVTRFENYGKEYLLVISSYFFEAFSKKSKNDNILNVLFNKYFGKENF
jgi:hypothetical protein